MDEGADFITYFLAGYFDIIYSDGVLNPSGVRFGPSEIYGALERFRNKIDDSICIGQRRPHDIDERVLLFVKMLPGCKLTPELEKEMRSVIRTLLSKRHEPAYIFEVPEIPVSTYSYSEQYLY